MREEQRDEHAVAAARTAARCCRWLHRHGQLAGLCRRLRLARRHGEQFPGSGDQAHAVAIGEQAVMADALEALGQHVHQETPDELMRRERHGLVPAGAFDPIVLVGEADAVRVGGDQPAVGYGDTVGIAAQIGKDLLGAAEWALA